MFHTNGSRTLKRGTCEKQCSIASITFFILQPLEFAGALNLGIRGVCSIFSALRLRRIILTLYGTHPLNLNATEP